MGIVAHEPMKTRTCAYKLRLDLMIEDDLDTTNENQECLICSGYPRECFAYTTLSHVLERYKTFRLEGRR
jgi:hypothetical protein